MNIKLKPIAESKVRQLGGDVCGVLVRKDGGVMAVSEHGRCTRLDAGVMGPVDGAQGGQAGDVVAWECSGEPGLYDNITRSKGEADHHRKIGRTVRPLVYGDTQPQPAVPEESRPLQVNRYGVDRDYFTKKLEIIIRDMRDYTPSELARSLGRLAMTANSETMREPEFNIGDLVDQPKYRDSTPTTPQADGWVRCEDRLPEPRRQSRKTPNGILAKHESGRITQFRDVTETLLQYMRNGPRKPTKFEQPVSERITEWMDLDAERAGGKQ